MTDKTKVVNVSVSGNVYGAGGIRQVAEDLRDVLDGADVILFGRNRRCWSWVVDQALIELAIVAFSFGAGLALFEALIRYWSANP